MGVLINFIKSLSTKISIDSEQINQRIQNQKIVSSKFKDVLKELTFEDLNTFIWLSTLKPNESFNKFTISILRNIEIRESERCIQELLKRNLIFKSNRNDYCLYESLRIFAEHLLISNGNQSQSIPRLGIKWVNAQQRIVLGVKKTINKQILEKDIYFPGNIYWHLKEARWEHKVESVIGNIFPLNKWGVTLPEVVFYNSANIEKMFLKVEENALVNLEDCPSESLYLFSKYSLMRNTQKIMMQNIPCNWVSRLYKSKKWSDDQVFAYLTSINDSEHKAEAIEMLGDILMPSYTSQIIDEIDKLKNESAKSKAIISAYRHVKDREKKQLIGQIKLLKNDAYRSLCISQIASNIPLFLLHQTYLIIEEMSDDVEQAKAIAAIYPHGTKPIQRKCFNLVQQYRDKNLKIKLLNQFQSLIPELKHEIIELVPQVTPNYINASIHWAHLEDSLKTTEVIENWLQKLPDLDQILFFSELISEANTNQIDELWEKISQPEKWAQLAGHKLSKQNEANWANAIIGCLIHLSDKQLKTLIQSIAHLDSAEIRGELCVQLLPFCSDRVEYQSLYAEIKDIDNPTARLKFLAQAVDYIPSAQLDVEKLLKENSDRNLELDVLTLMLERDSKLSSQFLCCLSSIMGEDQKFNYLRQTLDIISQKEMGNAIDIIFSLTNSKQRTELLNKVEVRLSDQEMLQLIQRINTSTYPKAELENSAKQIFRNYWESGLEDSKLNLPNEILAQLPQQPSPKNPNEDLSEILAIEDFASKSRVLTLYLKEIQWSKLEQDSLLKILKILSQGNALNFIEIFPLLVQGIAKVTGTSKMPKYGNLCEQLGNSIRRFPWDTNSQNKENISHIHACQESGPEIA